MALKMRYIVIFLQKSQKLSGRDFVLDPVRSWATVKSVPRFKSLICLKPQLTQSIKLQEGQYAGRLGEGMEINLLVIHKLQDNLLLQKKIATTP